MKRRCRACLVSCCTANRPSAREAEPAVVRETVPIESSAGPWRVVLIAGLLPLALGLGACASPTPVCAPIEATPVATPVSEAPAAARSGATDLAEAIRLYDATDYAGVIQKLQSSSRLWEDIPEVQISAYKYLAFSYCATERRLPCRRAFQSLLKVQPDFQLGPTEVSHPIWGREFVQARRDAGLADAEPLKSTKPVKSIKPKQGARQSVQSIKVQAPADRRPAQP